LNVSLCTQIARWYIVPADDKEDAWLMVSQIILKTGRLCMKASAVCYPVLWLLCAYRSRPISVIARPVGVRNRLNTGISFGTGVRRLRPS